MNARVEFDKSRNSSARPSLDEEEAKRMRLGADDSKIETNQSTRGKKGRSISYS
jgi:hypothetical protein